MVGEKSNTLLGSKRRRELNCNRLTYVIIYEVTLPDGGVMAGVALRRRKALRTLEVSLIGQQCGARSQKAPRFEPTFGRPAL